MEFLGAHDGFVPNLGVAAWPPSISAVVHRVFVSLFHIPLHLSISSGAGLVFFQSAILNIVFFSKPALRMHTGFSDSCLSQTNKTDNLPWRSPDSAYRIVLSQLTNCITQLGSPDIHPFSEATIRLTDSILGHDVHVLVQKFVFRPNGEGLDWCVWSAPVPIDAAPGSMHPVAGPEEIELCLTNLSLPQSCCKIVDDSC